MRIKLTSPYWKYQIKEKKMFRLIGYGENIGSGFPKILHAWQQVGWREPKLENKLTLEEVVLTLYVPEVVDIDGGQKTTQKTTQKLSDVQERVVAYLAEAPKASRKELADNIGLTEDGVKYHLNKLKEMGVIQRIGPDKGGHWEVLK